MKDFRGKELYIGDKVVIAAQTSTSAYYFTEGVIKSFCNRAGYECATVDFVSSQHWKNTFSSTKIAKLND